VTAAPTESYLKVAYDLRPAKQVERRMLVDAFQILAHAGFQIANYQYTGFGALQFVDFILFYKLLGIRDMLSVEHSRAIEKRVHFNRPFRFIRIEVNQAGAVIPTLSRDKQHILWLDYDDVLNESQLEDVWAASAHLSRGSILLITIDTEPPENSDKPRVWKRFFEEQAGVYLGKQRLSDYRYSRLPEISARVFRAAIESGLNGRDVRFLPLFKFEYSDGHRMLTLGGMIASEEEERKIKASRLSETVYARLEWEAPFVIRIPTLTRKERIYLDSEMPCPANWTPPVFELSADRVADYTSIYRFFPTYAELLL
jgi:hypothetical protein